jgi:hypothetical protein
VQALERCLASYAENGCRFGRSHEYVVADSSDSPDTRHANRGVLEALRARYGIVVSYAGPEERARFAESLCRHAGFPPEVVQFALLGADPHPVRTGANRNALLLHAVGDLLLQVDDDTVCSLAPAPEAGGGLRLSSFIDPTEFWFFREGEPALPPGGFRDEDFLGLHEQLLGRDVGACLGRTDADAALLDLDTAGVNFFRKLQSWAARVLVTATGVVGDSGVESSFYFLLLDGPSRARLLRNERDYRFALASHQLMRSVTRLTVCEGGAMCMGLNLGLDNRGLLPPFMPVGRNQDGIFAAVLRSCCPGAFQGFLPWLVQHLRQTPRPAGDLASSAAQVSSGHVLTLLASTYTPGYVRGNVGANLRALGGTLAALGEAARPDFEEVVRLHLWGHANGVTGRLEALQRKYGGQPGFWAADVRHILASVGGALSDPGYPLLADWPAGGGDALAALQQTLGRFGRLLEIWPDMVTAAWDLRQKGVRLAQPV